MRLDNNCITATRGFTLIELLIIIIMLSLASVALVTMFGQLAGNLGINHDINAAAQLAQECGEHLLSARREYGFAMNGINDCSALTVFNGNGPATVTNTDPYIGDGSNGCAVTASCKLFHVVASYGSGSAVLDIVVVNY